MMDVCSLPIHPLDIPILVSSVTHSTNLVGTFPVMQVEEYDALVYVIGVGDFPAETLNQYNLTLENLSGFLSRFHSSCAALRCSISKLLSREYGLLLVED